MGVKPQKPACDVFNGGLGAGLWSRGDAKQEARQLAGLLGKNGDTVESLRKLIAVPPRTEAQLRTFAAQHSESQRGIEQMLAYPRRVREEFERLIESKSAIEAV